MTKGKYERFEGQTKNEARWKVKMKLGPDALILTEREVRQGGLTGILGKKVWQVVACPPEPDAAPLPRPVASPAPADKNPLPAARSTQTYSQSRPKQKVRQPVDHLLDEPALPFSELPAQSRPDVIKPKSLKPYPALTPAVRPVDPGSESPALRMLYKEIRAISEKINAPPAFEHVILPGVLPDFYQRLLLQDVPRETAVDLMNHMVDYSTLDLNDEGKTLERLEEQLAARIPAVSLDELFSSRRPRILFMVGPSGVGKTTTLAKIAALACRDENLKVAFITLDTFRVAAAEQLKSYAQLIMADIEIVTEGSEFAAAVVRHSDKDMILVDTPGKNPCSPQTLSDLSGYLKHLSSAKLPSPAVLPVLSAATKQADLQRFVSCYRSLNPAAIVFTKVDETHSYGSLLPVLRTAELPVVFLTHGQDVPEHIEPANPRRIARRILGQ